MVRPERTPYTVRFDSDVLDMARRHAELSNPPISLNSAINLLVAAGAQVLDPDRLTEARTLSQAVALIERISETLDTDAHGG